MTEKLEKIKKRYFPQVIIGGVIVLAFITTLLIFLIGNKTERRQFLFPSADGDNLVIEYRNLAKKPVQGEVQLFVDEILLGSTVERTKMLFTPGTKVLSCFQRGDNLYLNISSDLLQMGESVIPIRDGAELLEKNIKINFPDIKVIDLYVDGNFAFEK